MIRAPHLRPHVKKLVEKMQVICRNKRGELDMSEFLTLLPDLELRNRKLIEGRGKIIFKGNQFENHANESILEIRKYDQPIKVTMPKNIIGNFSCTSEGFEFLFDWENDNTIQGCVKMLLWWACKKLQRVEFRRDRIFLDLEGDDIDTVIFIE